MASAELPKILSSWFVSLEKAMPPGVAFFNNMGASVSKAQQRAAQDALDAKRGRVMPDVLSPSARQMFDAMNEDQLQDFSNTDTANLPERANDVRPIQERTRVAF